MNKKLTLGIFTHDFYPYVGGQGRFVYEFYNQNLKYNLINLYIFSPSKNNLVNHIQIFPETRKSKLKNIEFSFKLGRSIDKFINTYGLDIINFQSGPGGVFFTKDVKVPVTFTSHHTYWQQSHYIKEQQWKKMFYYFEKKGFQKANHIICDCNSTKEILKKYYSLPEKKITVIPIGIDKDKFLPKNSSGNNNEILYLGRLDKRKGVDFLLQSMVLVNKKNPSIKLHIVGRGTDKAALESFAKKNNLNVVFHGFLTDEELTKLYEQVSAQVIPSMFEGFGLTVLEAMAKKIPIIATDVDGIKDLISHRNNGILVQYGNKDVLAKAVIILVYNSQLKKKLVYNAYNKLKKYNWQRSYFETIHEYKSVLKDHNVNL